MDSQTLLPLVLAASAVLLSFMTFLQHKREGTLFKMTLSHLPLKVRILYWYVVLPVVFVFVVVFIVWGF